jgi:hypothetical protein
MLDLVEDMEGITVRTGGLNRRLEEKYVAGMFNKDYKRIENAWVKMPEDYIMFARRQDI